MKRKLSLYKLVVLVGMLFFSCNQLYKAGNLVELGYPIESNLDGNVVSSYIDSLTQQYGYGVPHKWADEMKLVDIDSLNHKRIYFKSSPEEMYLISLGGMIVLADVYNENIRKGKWVAQKDSMPPIEESRVKQRFKKEILDVIESMAKRDGVPDSIIYKKSF